jgi:co-chaperonin GroES (HSP10)
MPYKKAWEKCGITPAGPRILVKPDEFMESYQGAIAIPDTVKSRSQYAQTAGYVVAVGSTAYKQREFGDGVAWCKVGDRIGFARYGGIVYRGVDGVQYRVISDDDVLTILSEEVKLDEGSVA